MSANTKYLSFYTFIRICTLLIVFHEFSIMLQLTYYLENDCGEYILILSRIFLCKSRSFKLSRKVSKLGVVALTHLNILGNEYLRKRRCIIQPSFQLLFEKVLMAYRKTENRDPGCLQVGPGNPAPETTKCLGWTRNTQDRIQDPGPQNLYVGPGTWDLLSGTRYPGPQNIQVGSVTSNFL